MAGATGGALVLPRGVLGARAYAASGHGTESDTTVTHTPALKKYVDPLPIPKTAIADPSAYPGADYYELTMRQGSWRFHRDLAPATVWGYWAANPNDPHKTIGMGYLGPTISVAKDHPTVIKYRNELPTTHLFQFVIDEIRKGNPQLTPIAPPPYKTKPPFPPNVNVWNVVHQHGGFTPPQSDGMPLQSFSPDGFHAESYTTLDPDRAEPNEAIYAYTNRERSCLLWYHDHGMGMTSVNVYAGLAGLWIVRDPADERLGLPQGEYEVPLILQDRTFNADGSLAYTMTLREGEDTPVVNGKAYPFLAVEQRRYRLRILNASNERFWRLRFDTPTDVLPQPTLPFWLIGTDGGFREPLQMLNFLIGPAERYDLIVDFSKMPMGTKIKLTNYNAPVHYPGGGGPEIKEIMEFQVTKQLSRGGDRTRPGKELKLPEVAAVELQPHTRRREWVLYQHKLFTTMTFNAVPFMEPSQDFIKAGSTEIWEYINPNHDAHPMHVHLVNFQVLNRQPIDATAYQEDYEKWLDGGRKPQDRPVLENYLTGPPIPPDPDEARSSKDTVKSYPETVTRIIIQEFDPPTGTIASIPGSGTELPATYVHHCHILEHEDDDLMRPWTIVADDDHGGGDPVASHGGHGH
ncbi:MULTISPECIES: multicopper oxidase domain-containing protein [unclassified Streptomyces]|uniref:multicopper oxidase family protein n=1 Tax=unclassified Streptomyces TaxID=2593676 RepID=UPI002E0E94DE|nr:MULTISPECIES: multicopper oxidase domain-containing protein [unclassified Streptomyces]WSR24101.1 multicopper oxidase domain-containing protein [Streptomyces sp. NBC_01205]